MLNDKLLRSYIVFKDVRHKDCARVANMSEGAFVRKLAGKVEFKASEIQALVNYLEIPDEHIRTIFFCPDVAKKETQDEC